jgi:hypothetical protein
VVKAVLETARYDLLFIKPLAIAIQYKITGENEERLHGAKNKLLFFANDLNASGLK